MVLVALAPGAVPLDGAAVTAGHVDAQLLQDVTVL